MYVYTFDDIRNSHRLLKYIRNSHRLLKLFTLPEKKTMLSQKHDDAISVDVLVSLS